MIDTSFKATTSRFNAFTDDLVRGLSGDDAQMALEAAALKFVEQVTAPPPAGTPIDTGRARAGWARALEGLSGHFDPVGDDRSAINEGKRRGGLRKSVGKRKGNIGYVAITNNVEYLIWLEYGHSDQAPGGFIRKALEGLRGEYRESAMDQLVKMLAEANSAARSAGIKWVSM